VAERLPEAYLARHGETEWSQSGRHTGRTDVPLTENGRQNARHLGERLKGRVFAKVLSSPLIRASETCRFAGFGDVAEVCDDLLEWDYGAYEGLRPAEIQAQQPGWELFRDGCPDGESPPDVAARADRVVGLVRAIQGDVLLFSSGHFLRTLAARWFGREPDAIGPHLVLSTGSLSILGYNHGLDEPAIRLWNDRCHLEP
jgi:broad specificity phosphatase PhoE